MILYEYNIIFIIPFVQPVLPIREVSESLQPVNVLFITMYVCIYVTAFKSIVMELYNE